MSFGGGTPYGGGDPWGSPSDFAAIMLTRLLMFVRHGPHFVAITNALATRTANLLVAANTIRAAFALDTAVGAQLDRIGGIVQLPRFGYDDTRYRALLHVQIDILLSSTSGAETLLAVVQAITGLAAPEYQEFYPAQFEIGAFVEPDEVTLLADFLRRAKGRGIYGGLVAYPDGAAPGEGGVLLGDLVTDEGLWSLTEEDRDFAARMTSTGATDLETGVAGTLDGTTWVPAFEARNFNGATDRIDWTNRASLTASSVFTVAGWVRFETLGGLRVIWVATQTAGPAQAFIVRTNGSALELSHAYSPGTSLQRISTAVLSTGVWYHIAAVYTGSPTASTTRLYLNGVQMSYATTTNGSGTPRVGDGTWAIGGRVESDANCSDADIAAIEYWPQALGPEEIWHLYEEGIAATGSFAGPPDDSPQIDNPGVGDLSTPTYALAYPTASVVTV